jgi:hypothetical protein
MAPEADKLGSLKINCPNSAAALITSDPGVLAVPLPPQDARNVEQINKSSENRGLNMDKGRY